HAVVEDAALGRALAVEMVDPGHHPPAAGARPGDVGVEVDVVQVDAAPDPSRVEAGRVEVGQEAAEDVLAGVAEGGDRAPGGGPPGAIVAGNGREAPIVEERSVRVVVRV